MLIKQIKNGLDPISGECVVFSGTVCCVLSYVVQSVRSRCTATTSSYDQAPHAPPHCPHHPHHLPRQNVPA